MSKKKRGDLSIFKEAPCPYCHEEITFNLAERRGDIKISCPNCDKKYDIKKVEDFVSTLSPIVKGNCPNCDALVALGVNARVQDVEIECQNCNEAFYIDEVENPVGSQTDDMMVVTEGIGKLESTTTEKTIDGNTVVMTTKDSGKVSQVDAIAPEQVTPTSNNDLFSGRLSRSNFILGFALNIVINSIGGFFLTLFFGRYFGGLLSAALFFGILVFMVSMGIRRLHDSNHSGWLLLLTFIPFLNILFWIYLIVAPPVDEGNKYGPCPDRSVDLRTMYGV